MRTQPTATRLELLIAPAEALPPGNVTARCLGLTLRDSREMELRCADQRIIVCADHRIEPSDPSATSDGVDIREHLWPEPVGMRLVTSVGNNEPSWSVEADRYGLRPIFHGFDRRGRSIVSTRPEFVAALIGAPLSAESLAEHLLVGFNLDDRSPYENVHRLRPGQRLARDGDRGFRVDDASVPHHASFAETLDASAWLEALTPTIVETMERGAALELSGGVDSRLVLAIALSAGMKPRLALTLGDERDEDVQLARVICTHFGIRHLVLPVDIDHNRLAADGRDFAMRSGFGVNACSYAWLPRAFRSLSKHRDIQIGGGGGECASGFYYSPIDVFCGLPSVRRSWVRRRLLTSGVDLSDVFEPRTAEALLSEVTETALRVLTGLDGAWRRRTDEFYLTQRVPNAGGAVLSASACWYEPVQPLLHGPHVEWGRSLAPFQRVDRRRQMHLIHELSADLGAIPYSHGRRHAAGAVARLRRRVSVMRSKGAKILRRLKRRRTTNDLGAISAAEALVQSPPVREALQILVSGAPMRVDGNRLAKIIASPRARQHELGALLNAAWAAEAVAAVGAALSVDRRPLHPASPDDRSIQRERAA